MCKGHIQLVKEFIAAGAKIEEPNENGHTPLMEAATANYVQLARLLIEAGASVNTHSAEFKESALTLACYKGKCTGGKLVRCQNVCYWFWIIPNII